MEFDYTLRVVALGAGALGLASGALGSFAVLRKQSLLGDAISHAALPGIVLAFLLTSSKSPLVLVLGAAAAGIVGTVLVIGMVGATRVKEDSALGIVLSVFFGFGLVLLTVVQRRPDASQAGLDRYLFGQAATMLEQDVVTIAVLGGLSLLVTALAWKEFKLLAFDPEFGRSLGLRMRRVDVLLTTVLVLSIVIGLQTVGVVLMSAMVVAPAAAARQWTDRLGAMVCLAAAFGAAAGVAGAILSSHVSRLPTGPTIVLCLTLLVIVSIAFAPGRGVVSRWLRDRRRRSRVAVFGVLSDLDELAAHHPGVEHGHSVAALEAIRSGRGNVARSLDALRDRGFARRAADGGWTITSSGRSALRERLERLGPSDALDPDALNGNPGSGGGDG